MKITKVDVMALRLSDPKTRPIVCRVYTDEGIYGDGEAALDYGKGALGAFGQLQDFATMVIGMDPFDTEVIWNKLHKGTFWGQNGGPVIFAAISAIDMACWDIKGKALNLPLYKLLGGKVQDNLRTYASQLNVGWGPVKKKLTKTEEYAEVAREAVAEGYDCLKYDFFFFDRDGSCPDRVTQTTGLLKPYYLDLIEERVAAVREAVGPQVDIIMENHSVLDANGAAQVAKRCEKYDIFAFEEPNTPTPYSAKWLDAHINIPIAQGERIFTRWQYAPYLNDRSVHLIQPDIGTCGGITEIKKIADMAHTFDVGVQVHVCASPLCTAAALHVECSIPNFIIHEHHRFCLFDMMKDICIYDYQPVNGRFKVPERPGLGNELSPKAIAEANLVTVK